MLLVYKTLVNTLVDGVITHEISEKGRYYTEFYCPVLSFGVTFYIFDQTPPYYQLAQNLVHVFVSKT